MTEFSLAEKFSKYPGGRHRAGGPSSGEELREDHLIPLLNSAEGPITVQLDGVAGLPPSFTEEAFGGLVRKLGAGVLGRLSFEGRNADEARRFMREEVDRNCAHKTAREIVSGAFGDIRHAICAGCEAPVVAYQARKEGGRRGAWGEWQAR